MIDILLKFYTSDSLCQALHPGSMVLLGLAHASHARAPSCTSPFNWVLVQIECPPLTVI